MSSNVIHDKFPFCVLVAGKAAEIVSKPKSTVVPVGGDAKFEVEVDGEPEPEVKWFKDGIEITPTARNRVMRDGNKVQLVMKNISPHDKGEITCEVSNRKGKDATTCKLDVQGQ